MIRPKIGLDWDDVTAPFNSLAIKMANEDLHIYPPLTLSDITSWANDGRASVIKRYYKSEALYNLQSMSISAITKKVVNELSKIADVYFVTAVCPEFMGVRAKQIKEAFPYLSDDRIILGAAKHLIQFDIILDDNACNVLDSPATFPVLMRKPWNNNITGLLSVNNMEEFLVLVKHILEKKSELNYEKGQVLALVGPSGSGKNLIADKLCEYDSMRFQRPRSYITDKCLPKDVFFESTWYAGKMYATKKDEIDSILTAGKNVIMPLDMCGAIGVKRHFPTTIIYIDKKKDKLLSAILEKDIPNDEKVLRILSIEAEKKNAALCDIVLKADNAAEDIIELF